MNKVLVKYLSTGVFLLASFYPKEADAQSKIFPEINKESKIERLVQRDFTTKTKQDNTKVNIATELNGPTSREVIGNMYSQPNIHLQVGRKMLDWYGSGDVNNDEVVNNEDKNLILGSTSDRADVDGDGIPGTNADKSKLVQYLNGQIDYLPGYQNKLKTKAERIFWIENAILPNVDVEQYKNNGEGWVCANLIIQMNLEITGISNVDEFVQTVIDGGGVPYRPEYNARFNWNSCFVHTKSAGGIDHAVGGIFIGDGNSSSTNVLNFDDWYFFNYFSERTYPGTFHMNENEFANIGKHAYLENSLYGNNYFDFIRNMIKFDLNNGEGTIVDYRDSIQVFGGGKITFVILDNPNDDRVNVSQLEDIVVHAGSYPANFVFDVNSLEGMGYLSKPEVTTENTPLEPEVTYTYHDTTNTGGENYSFNVTTIGKIESGGVINSDSSTYRVNVDFTTDIDDEEPQKTPDKFDLYLNYPNPFNPETTIKYSTRIFGDVKFEVYDVNGRKLETRVKKSQSPGEHEFKMNFNEFSSGIYILQMLQTGEPPRTIKLNYIK